MEAAISEVRSPFNESPASPAGVRTARIGTLRMRIEDLKQQTRKHFQQGATGLQTASYMSNLLDAFLVRVFEEVLAESDPAVVESLRGQTALIATGGTGRGDVCPFSDVDLLFLNSPKCGPQFELISSQVQRDLWDAGLKIGGECADRH